MRWKPVSGDAYQCPACGLVVGIGEVPRQCPDCGFSEIPIKKIKGAKYDDGKPCPSAVPVEAILAILDTRMYGFNKYGDAEDWRSIEPERWHEALLRHVLAIWEDPTHIDEESGLPSLYHVMTNGAFLCACLKDIFEEKARE